ncbi:MAG: hypothetical protein ACREBY_02780 [Polaromonas sp.]
MKIDLTRAKFLAAEILRRVRHPTRRGLALSLAALSASQPIPAAQPEFVPRPVPGVPQTERVPQIPSMPVDVLAPEAGLPRRVQRPDPIAVGSPNVPLPEAPAEAATQQAPRRPDVGPERSGGSPTQGELRAPDTVGNGQ